MGWLPDLVALGTMHGKEQAIAPPLAALGIRIESTAIDTDRFGTFSRNVPRSGNMLEAARSKARAAAEATGLFRRGAGSGQGAWGQAGVAATLRRARKGGVALRATVTANAAAFGADLAPVIEEIREGGHVSLRVVAAELTAWGIRTRRGGKWGVGNVRALLKGHNGMLQAHLISTLIDSYRMFGAMIAAPQA